MDAGARGAVAAWEGLDDFWASAALSRAAREGGRPRRASRALPRFGGLFRPTEALEALLDQTLGALLAAAPRPRVAVHLRRGDACREGAYMGRTCSDGDASDAGVEYPSKLDETKKANPPPRRST